MTLISVFLACAAFGHRTAGDATREPVAAAGERPLVLCTTVPIHYLASRVASGDGGGEARPDAPRIELLVDPNVGCPHDYALTPRDRKRIADAALILANGLGLDDFLPRKGSGSGRIVDVAAGCEAIEGPACDHDHAAEKNRPTPGGPAPGQRTGGEEQAADAHRHEHARNPHVWLSPRQAALMTRAIADELARLDPAGAKTYAAGSAALLARLETLAKEVESAAERLRGRKIAACAGVFDYLARDLKLEVVATLETHDADGASPRAMSDAIASIRRQAAAIVVREQGNSERVSQAVARNAGVPLVELDSLTRCEPAPPPAGWYESRIRANLVALLRALTGG